MKKILILLFLECALFGEEWAELPSTIFLENAEIKTIQVVGKLGSFGSNHYLYNKNSFAYSSRGPTPSKLILEAKNPITTFYMGNMSINPNSNLVLNLNTNFAMDKNQAYTIAQDAKFQANGSEFTMYGGSFSNGGAGELNFTNSVNIGGSLINEGGELSINVGTFNNGRYDMGLGTYGSLITSKGGVSVVNVANEFDNFGYVYQIQNGEIIGDKKLNAKSKILIKEHSKLSIQGGDVYNGVGFGLSGSGIYYSGAGFISVDNSEFRIEKSLISQGSGRMLDLSKYDNASIVHSQIIANNKGYIRIGGDFTNREFSDITLNGGTIEIIGAFKTAPHTEIDFGGNCDASLGNVFGKIIANSVALTDAKIEFYKGNAKTDTPYVFVDAKTSLQYNPTLLGAQEVFSNDGTPSAFYQAMVTNDGNKLKIIFSNKNNGSSISEIISNNIPLSENEKNIIDSIHRQSPLLHFDITNMGLHQIKNIAQDIYKGLNDFVVNKNKLARLGFDINRASIFDRMAKSMTSNTTLASNVAYNHYAANTVGDYHSEVYGQYDPISPSVFQQQILKNKSDNSVYIGLLGAYQKDSPGNGYGYGINGGYDRWINKNLFLGAYLSYMGGGNQSDFVDITTQSMQIGGYGRALISIVEADAIIGYGYSANQAIRNVSILGKTYKNDSKYHTHSLNFLLQTGPKFNLGHHVLKPYIGMNFIFDRNHYISEDKGVFAGSYLLKNDTFMGVEVGVEYRKMIQKGYFFIRSSLEYTFYSNLKNTQIIFLDSVVSIGAPFRENFASVIVGGEIPLNQSFFINLNASAKLSNQKTFITTAMASLKFIF
ncbi:autotransporter outer membrane beta-barrel domain-containing protein [Helicobacter sp. 11S03491-1]|uniref:autotransporter outer membrane beta-barrel domain-containing protein n=1 Tax=Helicobacter sp. 11S03491-1 TaxID=1476196 RepID=UPI000BA6F700|nr:autotransporter outer membrane beta-barrel domain-containing protein [Helicobacter sp. 11S03491-1]PAF43803.1 hypothetical protein BKH45_00630 [Helicobacter sp. 11S03491-1]